MFFKKDIKETDNKELGFEERERHTPIAGYVLLIAMTIVSAWLGFTALSDLENVPTKPQALSSCSVPYISYGWQDSWRSMGTYYEYTAQPVYSPEAAFPYKVTPPTAQPQPCVFSDLERKAGVEAAYGDSRPVRDQLANFRNQLSQKQNTLAQIDSQTAELRRQYEIGIGEKGAQVPSGIYSLTQLQAQLKPLEEQKTGLTAEVNTLESQISTLSDQLKPSDVKLKALYQNVLSDWRWQWRWYELWVFALQSLFVFPFFFLVLRWYFRLSAKNSPYTIIATFVLATAAIFVVVIAGKYFWSLFLAALLEGLWEIIKNIQILRSLITYAGMFLTIGLFGGSVYLLQKKIFDPARTAMRRLRDNKCPACQFSLKLANNYCPHCGIQVLEKCMKCQNARYTGLKVCPHCGDRK